MTPIELRFLLECYYSPEALPTSLQEKSFADSCVEQGILIFTIENGQFNKGSYRTTDKGKAWIKVILDVPVPELRYVDYMGRTIDATD